ncbi:nudix hydrolase 19, chloroplastic [Nicotiana tomentosiformis]|uniref:nudix hydrolase 19, chloroplastic n=1 Tax=Nicotiana tomentosiformis TaxID=4098 RepID=UPI00051CA980|nr:nudix hydrolase 19, chloroplastic [Nicotiana tomentosiformis]XP_009595401.1 nudix hydrolase 19, chloroplastic [Nicotiana tomentosiformis]XP_018624773.1 nudix hydrolase 19, chloroplastic [Nicotiana tomentosiformis]XP_018624775.1 nudix hydrolase 19, chloroplastic [Nicotiana tomentosiformis]
MIFRLSFSNSSQLVSLSQNPRLLHSHPLLSMNLFKTHAFAGNPIKLRTPKPSDPFSPASALHTLKTLLLKDHTDNPSLTSPNFKILPFRKGRPLAGSLKNSPEPNWHLAWLSFNDCKAFLENSSEVKLSEDSLVYLGSDSEGDGDGVYVVYWAIDVTEAGSRLVNELGARQFCFVELRTLMVASDWEDASAMAQLAIAGHARSLLEWHTVSRFCGFCGGKNNLIDAGRRKQCSNELCKKKIYPRVDPVVIMLVIDKENDCVLLSRQSRFVPRMWSCLAGFIEPGESLEEAVRRETWEETGIEVGQVVYHSSQPWPVGPSTMPCQLMVGFFAYAKSLDINVDKVELEDAKWHSREDVKKALTFAEYKKAQRTAAGKVDQMCKGVERGQSLSSDFNVESGELAPMFIPGPFAIAHHLISSWVNGAEAQVKQLASSFSNL